MKYEDIPQFTKCANYHVDVSWSHLEAHLKHWAENYNLVLEPEFQRAHVWDDEKRSRYVEYILRGGMSGKDVYFNCPEFGHSKAESKEFRRTIYLVDGLQRLTAVRKFMNDEIRAFGSLRSEFEGMPRITHHRFSVWVNDLPTYKMVLQWYLDLNEGGVIHTEEELEKVRVMLRDVG